MRSRSSPTLLAPGAAQSSHSARAPGRNESLPAVDDRLVAPEAHAEIVDGIVYRTMGANPPHAIEHLHIARVFGDCLAKGYEGAVDMLTRSDEDTDAAPDVSVFPTGPDPVTGGRKLEEIAFEVLDAERLSHTTTKAEKLARRGVRRLFCIRVADRRVLEWSHEHNDWQALEATAEIQDRCFRIPIPVAALVDRVLADDTVARALLAGKNRVLEEALAQSQGKGHKEGTLQSHRKLVLAALAARGPLTASQRELVTRCDDVSILEGWFGRALRGEDAAAVLGE